MKYIYYLIILTLFIPIDSFGQADDFHMFGFSFSETDYETADFFKLTPENGQLEVLSVAKGIGLFSKGASIYDDWRGEYLIWAQNTKGVKGGYVFNPNDGNLIRKIKTSNPPVDLQYDHRLRNVYGLRYALQRKGIEIVKIEEDYVKTVAKMTDLKQFEAGNTTFDSNRGLYIFTARDQYNEKRLYRVNVQNGNILDQPLVDEYIFDELEYDLQDNKLYGMARKSSNVSQYFFVEINPLNAYPTIIRPIFGLQSVELGLSTFNHKTGAYIFVGENKNKETHLYQLDVLSGSIISKVQLFEKLSELQMNNSEFVADLYEDVKIFEDNNQDKDVYFSEKGDNVLLLAEVVVKDNIQLRPLNSIEDKSVEAVIYNIYGQIVLSEPIFLDIKMNKQIDARDLKSGIYTIKVKTKSKIFAQRFMKL